jgi:galactokinase
VREPDQAGQVSAWFRQSYGIAPECVWHAPGRVNLIGEHTDYNDGLVLPFALGRGTLAAAARRGDGVLELCSMQAPGAGVTVRVSELEPGAVTGWAAYPAGVAWAMREAGLDVGGARVAIGSDLPRGAGLASSAALECAVIMALTDLYHCDRAQAQAEVQAQARPGRTEFAARSELAALARRAENDFVGMPCGIMDQSASLLCEAGHALLLDCRSGQATAVPLDPAAAGLSLLVIDTRARHALADSQYGARRRDCQAAARALGVASLREITDAFELAGRLSDPVLRRRAAHVVTENQRVAQTARLLQAGQLSAAGPLLSQSHQSLRDDFEVSWPQADVTVDAALEAGALGARMTGGGFGGCVIALLPAERAAQVRAAVGAAFAARSWPQPEFLDAGPAGGARRVG